MGKVFCNTISVSFTEKEGILEVNEFEQAVSHPLLHVYNGLRHTENGVTL